MPFTFENTGIEGLILIHPVSFPDERGFFMESYKQTEFASKGIPDSFVQDNHSLSRRGVLRGLHFQLAPSAQGKLVRVISGRVWDVAVDLREGSPTRLQWRSFVLDDKTRDMVFIPAGCAHGFLSTADDTHLVYKCTAEYDRATDSGIRWDDAMLGIAWPIDEPIVSAKDRGLPSYAEVKGRLRF